MGGRQESLVFPEICLSTFAIGLLQSENAFERHQSYTRSPQTRGSLGQLLRILNDTCPEVVSDCLIQETPYLEVVMDASLPPVFIRAGSDLLTRAQWIERANWQDCLLIP